MPANELIIFTSADGKVSVQAQFEEDTVCLSLDQMPALFDRNKSTISRHLNNVFEEGELERSATVANFATVQTESERRVERKIEHFNLDVIISVGYRVKSLRGTQFRQWATKRLNEHIRKGFALDDERLKATHRHTTAEVIYHRADSNKPQMGMSNFKGEYINRNDVGIAKNHLTEKRADHPEPAGLAVSRLCRTAGPGRNRHDHGAMDRRAGPPTAGQPTRTAH